MEESNVQPVRCPVTVCGDIHGQFVSPPSFPCHDTSLMDSMIYLNYSESEETRPTRIIYSWEITLIEDTIPLKRSLYSLRSNYDIGIESPFYVETTSRDRSPKSMGSTTSV